MPCSDGRAWMRVAREDGFSAEVLTHEDGLTPVSHTCEQLLEIHSVSDDKLLQERTGGDSVYLQFDGLAICSQRSLYKSTVLTGAWKLSGTLRNWDENPPGAVAPL